MNIYVFPEYLESYLEQAKLYLYKGEIAPAKERLLQVLSVEPGNATAARLIDLVEKSAV